MTFEESHSVLSFIVILMNLYNHVFRILLVIALISIFLTPGFAETGIARAIPSLIEPTGIISINLTVYAGTSQSYSLWEYIPQNWTVLNMSTTTCQYDQSARKITCAKYTTSSNGLGAINISYNLTAPASGQYAFSGIYSIQGMAVENNISGDTTATIGKPRLSVSISGPDSGEPNTSLQFSSSSSGGEPPYTYNWNFGDGFKSTDQNPSHAYASTGTYTITLVMNDSSGSVQKTGAIVISGAANNISNTTTNQSSANLTSSITRSMPASVVAGSMMTVVLNIDLPDYSYYTIQEAVPMPWFILSVSNPGCTLNASGDNLVLCVAMGASPGRLSYDVYAPSGIALGSVYNFSGNYTFSSPVIIRSIIGAGSVTISNQKTCPLCSSPGQWSSCENGNKARTKYVCDNSTYTCVSQQDIQSCCMPCSANSTWSGCVNNIKTRTINVCSVVTSYKCADMQENETCVSEQANLTIDTYPVKGNAIVDGAGWGVSPQTRSIAIGSHTVSFGDVTGYTKPNSETINIDSNGAVVNKSYVKQQEIRCGDGICNGNETSAVCSQDCSIDISCIASIDKIDSDSLELKTTCLKKDALLSWKIDKPQTFPIIRADLKTAYNLNSSEIAINKLSRTDLSDAYQYLNIIPSFNNSIKEMTIRFAVRNTWITTNKIDANSIKLNRYEAYWQNIPTTKTGSDENYTYYQATITETGIFGINGQKSECPVCSPATTWSSCADGVRKRTNNLCDKVKLECVPTQETEKCCMPCTPDTDWTECKDSKQARKTYKCSEETSFNCIESPDERSCITRSDAEFAMASAQTAIDIANNENKNTTKAKISLLNSQASFADTDYEKAKRFADESRMFAQNAPILAQPFFLPIPFEFLAIIIIAAAAGAAGFLYWKRHQGFENCIVCEKPTAMHFKCSACAGSVCFRHSKVDHGKLYCDSCLRMGLNKKSLE